MRARVRARVCVHVCACARAQARWGYVRAHTFPTLFRAARRVSPYLRSDDEQARLAVVDDLMPTQRQHGAIQRVDGARSTFSGRAVVAAAVSRGPGADVAVLPVQMWQG